MSLKDVREIQMYAKQCGIKCEYKHLDVFDYEVKMLDETFTSRKLAIKFIDRAFVAKRG